jgi:hypothetical protein
MVTNRPVEESGTDRLDAIEGNNPTTTNSAVPNPNIQKVKAQIAEGIFFDVAFSTIKLNFISTKFSLEEEALKEVYHKTSVINITRFGMSTCLGFLSKYLNKKRLNFWELVVKDLGIAVSGSQSVALH